MHPDIEKFINIALQGETITPRQREIILNKAAALGEDPDEVEMILEQRISQREKNSQRETGTYDFHHSGCIYEGEMKNGVAEGKGTLYYPDKFGVVFYKGGFHNGNRHGKGTLYLEDGVTKIYEGDWVNDDMDGKGITYWEDGVTIMYEGDFFHGEFEGEGTTYDNDGQMTYKGGFHNSEYDGRGSFFHNGQKLFEGEYSRGQMIRGAIFKNGVKAYEGLMPPPEI